MASYEWLNSLPAKAFLDPHNFWTEYDERNKAKGYDKAQYQKGLETGRAAKSIYISEGSVWSAEMKSGSMLCSYERIGYHACTADLLRGFLDSGCEIIVYRRDEGTVKIKEAQTDKPKHPFEGRCSNFGCSICGGPQDEPT